VSQPGERQLDVARAGVMSVKPRELEREGVESLSTGHAALMEPTIDIRVRRPLGVLAKDVVGDHEGGLLVVG
jgi:hypothetical protein